METRNYKTLRGLLSHACSRRQVTAEDFFSGRIYHVTKGWVKITLPAEEKRRAAEMFAKYLFATPSARRGVADALCEGRGDLSLLHCFYIILSKTWGLYACTSLSGPGFDFCKRSYKKSI